MTFTKPTALVCLAPLVVGLLMEEQMGRADDYYDTDHDNGNDITTTSETTDEPYDLLCNLLKNASKDVCGIEDPGLISGSFVFVGLPKQNVELLFSSGGRNRQGFTHRNDWTHDKNENILEKFTMTDASNELNFGFYPTMGHGLKPKRSAKCEGITGRQIPFVAKMITSDKKDAVFMKLESTASTSDVTDVFKHVGAFLKSKVFQSGPTTEMKAAVFVDVGKEYGGNKCFETKKK